MITSPDSVCINNPVSFKNGSILAPLSTSWSFGDGHTSTVSNPSDTYTTPGPYQVKLVNTYSTCVDSVTKTVTAVTSPTVNFTATTTTACSAPFTATFQDASTPAIGLVKRTWNFGDGSPLDSTAAATITHTYTTPGNYDVTLTVANSGGCTGTRTKTQFIQVVAPSVILQPAQIGGCAGTSFLQPTALVTSADGVASYAWSAPGATPATSTSPTPSFSYATPGQYNISLTIQTNDGCTVTTNFPNAALVGTPTPAAFSASATNVCRPTIIAFHSTSAPADKWDWNFGDGVLVETDTPGIHHTYKNQGNYNVLLTVTHNGCPTTAPVIIITVNVPVAGFTYAGSCMDKYKVFFTDTSAVDPTQATTYIWDFGDGSTPYTITIPAGGGPSIPPPHIYPALGNWTATLSVSNASCMDVTTRTVVLDSLAATFSVLDSVCRNGNYTNDLHQSPGGSDHRLFMDGRRRLARILRHNSFF